MTEAAIKVYDETRLQRLIDHTIEKMLLNLFEKTNGKALACTYIELHQMVEQSAAKVIYHGGADDLINTKIGSVG